MARVFGDAFYYIALLSPRDQAHVTAMRFASQATSEIVTTDPIFVEVLAFFARAGPHARAEAAGVVDDARGHPLSLVLPQTRELFDAGLDLYRSRLDKGYSLTDCMSMALCRQLDITEVLTHDDHFRQEGFTVLL